MNELISIFFLYCWMTVCPNSRLMITLELGKLFPSIPLVAEEDSTFLRTISKKNVVDYVVKAVVDQLSNSDEAKSLSSDDLLEAIDRGGQNAFTFNAKLATYWVCHTTSRQLQLQEKTFLSGISLSCRFSIQLMEPEGSWRAMMLFTWYFSNHFFLYVDVKC